VGIKGEGAAWDRLGGRLGQWKGKATGGAGVVDVRGSLVSALTSERDLERGVEHLPCRSRRVRG
jgi:hypothetical protein